MFKQIAWNLVKSRVKSWLITRALVLPAVKKAELAKKFGVPVSIIDSVNEELIAQAAAQVDTFKP